jgi:hypothetical protein
MIAALFALLQVVAPPVLAPPLITRPVTAPPVVAPVRKSPAPVGAPLPPRDWSTLPMLPVGRSVTAQADTSTYVRAEVLAGRCTKAVRTARGWALTVDLAVLTTPDGHVRRVTPRAIDCPTVEQYAAGIMLGSVRNSIDVDDPLTNGWYRVVMNFTWGP